MSTKNSRINVTFEAPFIGLLADLAAYEHKSVAGIVRELTLEALEKREDIYFSKLADALDQPGVETFSHDDAWK